MYSYRNLQTKHPIILNHAYLSSMHGSFKSQTDLWFEYVISRKEVLL